MPFGQQALGHLAGDARVAEHHRDDRMAGPGEREAGRRHPRPEPLRVALAAGAAGSSPVCSSSSTCSVVAAITGASELLNRYGRDRCRNQSTISCRPLVYPPRRAAERLAERAGDDVDAVHHAAVLGRAAAAGADEADRVRVVDHHHRVVLVGEVADRARGRRSRRPSRTRRRWRSAGSGRRRPPAAAAPAGPCRCCRSAVAAPCTGGCRR